MTKDEAQHSRWTFYEAVKAELNSDSISCLFEPYLIEKHVESRMAFRSLNTISHHHPDISPPGNTD
jgi:hypothetical protein